MTILYIYVQDTLEGKRDCKKRETAERASNNEHPPLLVVDLLFCKREGKNETRTRSVWIVFNLKAERENGVPWVP